MNVILAAAQFASTANDFADNIDAMNAMAKEAKRLGARCVVFPELCLSGYLPAREIRPIALDGPEMGKLKTIASQTGIALAFGFAEKSTPKLRNTMAYVSAGGNIIHLYRKTHLWDTEAQWADPGDRIDAFDAEFARCGLWICYEARFPEVAKTLAVDGARVCLAGSAWLGPADEWETLVRARSLDAGVFAAASPLQGEAGPFSFHGAALVCDPHGRILAKGVEGKDMVIAAECDLSVVDEFRTRVRLMENRRPWLYR